MQTLNILNTRAVKEIKDIIMKQWECEPELDYAFLRSGKEDNVFIVNKDAAKLELSNLRIDSIGLYLGQMCEDGLRLSIEGSQIIGPFAKKNIIELNREQTEEWFKGHDIQLNTECTGYVILKYQSDYLGCGKAGKNNKIVNYVPKVRRTNII
jgi:NOL1/NOP2/fmu family ribosome biogenesis protein